MINGYKKKNIVSRGEGQNKCFNIIDSIIKKCATYSARDLPLFFFVEVPDNQTRTLIPIAETGTAGTNVTTKS